MELAQDVNQTEGNRLIMCAIDLIGSVYLLDHCMDSAVLILPKGSKGILLWLDWFEWFVFSRMW